ncbi:MAG TPA: mercuric ion transporter MerT [Gemmatimonadaceae bacterium]
MAPEKTPESPSGRTALVAGGLAAILASTCCLGPLVLLALGVSGAWIGTLTRLEPYRPLFLGVALVAVAFAQRRIFRMPTACAPGEVCAIPRVQTAYRVLFWTVVVLLAIAFAFPFIAPLFY